jgi:hypothetical protein
MGFGACSVVTQCGRSIIHRYMSWRLVSHLHTRRPEQEATKNGRGHVCSSSKSVAALVECRDTNGQSTKFGKVLHSPVIADSV